MLGWHHTGDRETIATIKRTYPWTRLTKYRVVGSNCQVTHQVQDMSAADSVPGYHCDHWFGAGANLTLEIKNIKVVLSLFILVSRIPSNSLITTGAKRFVPCAGDDDHAD